MGQVIARAADAVRIEEHMRRSLRAGLVRGGKIAQAAQERLGPSLEAIEAAAAVLRTAKAAAANTWAVVIGEDDKSDAAIADLRDAMRSALGRPRQSPYLDQVFPDGIATYTEGDPREQPVMMQVLISRVLSTAATPWTLELRQKWAAELEALRKSYQAAVDANQPAQAAAKVAEVTYHSVVRSGQGFLRAFKRDLQNLSLDEAQIHEIIPDASRPTENGGTSPPQPQPVTALNGGGVAPSS
jgi:hypothetical protein